MSNRTTVKSNIQGLNVPSVSNADLEDMLNDNICDNVKFLDDVAVTQVSTVSSITVDFTGKDRIDLTRTGGSLAITVTGLNDGNQKQLLITKTAGQAVTFVGVTDITPVAADVTALATVLYDIVRKGSNYYARAWIGIGDATTSRAGILETATASEANALSATNKIITPGTIPVASDSQKGVVERATSAECDALADTERFVTPGRIPYASTVQQGISEYATQSEAHTPAVNSRVLTPNSIQPTAWLTATGLQSGWSGSIYYYRDAINIVHVVTENLKRSTGFTGYAGQPVWQLPSGYRPSKSPYIVVQSLAPSGSGYLRNIHVLVIDVADNYLYLYPEPDDYVANREFQFYISYRAE